MPEAEVSRSGEIVVDGQCIGRLQGFQFAPAANGNEAQQQDTQIQAAIVARAQQISESPNDKFILTADNLIRWQGEEVARVIAGESELEPGVLLLADSLTGAHREWVEARLKAFVRHHITQLLKPLFDLRVSTELEGIARSLAFQLVEALGIVERARVAKDVKSLDQNVRRILRTLGVRFGAYHIYLPALLKPKPRALAVQLWLLKNGQAVPEGAPDLMQLVAGGRTTLAVEEGLSPDSYRMLGYKVLGTRAVRIDILERLADQVRAILAYRPGATPSPPPKGKFGNDQFAVTVEMTSLLGCSGENFSAILRALGYTSEAKPRAEVEAAAKALQDSYAASQPPVAEPAPPTEESSPPVAQTEQAQAAAANTEETMATEAPVAEPVLPETIEVWKYVRPERKFHKRAKPAAAEERKGKVRRDASAPTQEGQERKPRPRHPRKGDKKERREQDSERRLIFSTEDRNKDKADPNSPFAKLAALKSQLPDKG